MKKSRKFMIMVYLIVIGMNIISLSKNDDSNDETTTEMTRPILILEQDEKIQRKINENSFPIEYNFWIYNYQDEEINLIEFDYVIGIDCSVDNFPVSYRLMDCDNNEEIFLIDGKSENLKIEKDVKKSRKFKLILEWRELDEDLADQLQINLKIDSFVIGQIMNEKIINLTRDSTLPICKVSYSTEEMTNQDVLVTLSCEKEVEQVSGFQLSADKKTLTKKISENTSEKVTIRDLSGNYVEVEYQVENIDKEPPQIIGCEDGGSYKGPLNLEYYDNNQIKDIKIDQYSDELLVTAYENETEPSKLMINIDAHPLNTKKYKYYVNGKPYCTVIEPNYVFTSFHKELNDEIKIEAIDEFGNVLDTVIIEEIKSDYEEKNLKINQNQLTQKGNYQIKVTDFAGNETLYHIKVK